jgi:Putative addiction module component
MQTPLFGGRLQVDIASGIPLQLHMPFGTGLWQATNLDPLNKDPTMSLPVEALELEVLRLPAAERERLLDRVIASLDADKDRDKAWDNLAAKRDTEIERGESTPVSGPEVVARLRAELS